MTKKFHIRSRIQSFRYAFNGLKTLLITQHNAWIHFVATAAVVAYGIYEKIELHDWIPLVIAISTVWIAEALNTAMEFLCDAAVPEIHPLIEKAKDVAAGAVLLSALSACITGFIVFYPYV